MIEEMSIFKSVDSVVIYRKSWVGCLKMGLSMREIVNNGDVSNMA